MASPWVCLCICSHGLREPLTGQKLFHNQVLLGLLEQSQTSKKLLPGHGLDTVASS